MTGSGSLASSRITFVTGGTSEYGSTFAWMNSRPPLISCSIG